MWYSQAIMEESTEEKHIGIKSKKVVVARHFRGSLPDRCDIPRKI